jgi:hypothetical protein
MFRVVLVATLSRIVRRYWISPGDRHCVGWCGFCTAVLCGYTILVGVAICLPCCTYVGLGWVYICGRYVVFKLL